ncbi:MAG: radical SAM family heme chaperone HemW [Muribaculaceae bacterium]|nr:radical SAM family heme chaperone HemW [Muribaculaceae bacterium]
MCDCVNRGGVYIHVAVCRSKCIYCDFYSEVRHPGFDWERYVKALVAELELRSCELSAMRDVSLYIGGGTPSLMPAGLLRFLVSEARRIIRSAGGGDVRLTEVTLEVNPDDVTAGNADVWLDAGIDRVSMGVQSMNDKELRSIGRRHDCGKVMEAYRILRQRFGNLSLDLMFGLPGQTLESLSSTLDIFTELHPEHISAYSLMFEERTALTRLRDMGRIEETDENISVAMFEMVNERLREAGYVRYEISNYALPGFESRHNSAYWEGVPYTGIGPSAHSFDGRRCRRWNISDIRAYMHAVENGEKCHEEEMLSDKEVLEERIMTGLRTAKGVDIVRFEKDFGKEARVELLDKAAPALGEGCLKFDCNRLSLTDKGVMLSDDIIVDLF